MNTPASTFSEWPLSASEATACDPTAFDSSLAEPSVWGLSFPEILPADPLSAVPDLLPTRTHGFTLARLLLVIAITGLLSMMAAPTLIPLQP